VDVPFSSRHFHGAFLLLQRIGSSRPGETCLFGECSYFPRLFSLQVPRESPGRSLLAAISIFCLVQYRGPSEGQVRALSKSDFRWDASPPFFWGGFFFLGLFHVLMSSLNFCSGLAPGGGSHLGLRVGRVFFFLFLSNPCPLSGWPFFFGHGIYTPPTLLFAFFPLQRFPKFFQTFLAVSFVSFSFQDGDTGSFAGESPFLYPAAQFGPRFLFRKVSLRLPNPLGKQTFVTPRSSPVLTQVQTFLNSGFPFRTTFVGPVVSFGSGAFFPNSGACLFLFFPLRFHKGRFFWRRAFSSSPWSAPPFTCFSGPFSQYPFPSRGCLSLPAGGHRAGPSAGSPFFATVGRVFSFLCPGAVPFHATF